ncbi:glycosyltransferase family 2 protein [Asticcacaulis sp. DXS10W]|uniref:Glycosyltransferase family 2 protein n=1 Tax=Asticcacaulis currens TaxID=2984210 RepID=A0ABT5IGG9_9CAUL|nr:glycosyltransferase family 2 protein [Asticcacaulis currens]MDC7695303.1 glycosyltransferase family 2 protein [Asticcacaulis currens]
MPPEPKRQPALSPDLAESARPNLYVVSDSARGIAPLPARFSARTPPAVWQWAALAALTLALVSGLWLAFGPLTQALYWLCWGVFMLNASLRLAACVVPVVTHTPAPLADADLPVYSVIVALYKEAAIAPQLIAALEALDYPRHRLEILFAIEDDDPETLIAFEHHLNRDLHPHRAHMRVVRVETAPPRTKPRALNFALQRARGDLVAIYDAEDIPVPRQLREAAAHFASLPARVACLQAPLRPAGARGFIARQFAAEYAVQFDVLLPALHRAGLTFPLGGTSNHFRVEALKAAGAWDAHNVTEDADLAYRLARQGYGSGLIAAPTRETPPPDTRTWLPQRTRWLKGHMQTLLVHTRSLRDLPVMTGLGLMLSLGMNVFSALFYAPFVALVLAGRLVNLLQPGLGGMAIPDLILLICGPGFAQIALHGAARRAGLHLSLWDRLSLPVYWGLQSFGAAFALYQLVMRPFHWDKTEHLPAEPAPAPAS